MTEPLPSERVYYRDALTGDLGFLVQKDGKDYIRLDRPSVRIERLFRAQEWIPDKEHRPLSRAQLAQVALAADKELCKLLGLHKLSRREWAGLSEPDRIEWMEKGPKSPEARVDCYLGIMVALEKLAT